MKILETILIGLLRCYRLAVSPIFNAIFTPMGMGCRFHPTCSEYALEAVRRYGGGRGSVLAIKRVCRCHPWGGCGCDPVPDIQCRAGNATETVAVVGVSPTAILFSEPEFFGGTPKTAGVPPALRKKM